MSDYGNTPPPPPPPSGGDGNYGSVPPGGGYAAPPPPAGGVSGPAPSNNLILAIISLLCCWPIGIPAVVFAAQVNGKWNAGDHAGAIESAAKAKRFAIIALVLGIIATILYVILIAAGVVSTNSSSSM